MMGGRAAEELFIGEVSTGASNDFKHATDIARMMVRDYGMSARLGPVSLAEERPSVFLRSAGVSDVRTYSERTAQVIDEEICALVAEALERARQVLGAHREVAEKLAARLLATEVVEEEDLVRILGPRLHREQPSTHTHPDPDGEPGAAPTQA
jgi:cell division protease FtsH